MIIMKSFNSKIDIKIKGKGEECNSCNLGRSCCDPYGLCCASNFLSFHFFPIFYIY